MFPTQQLGRALLTAAHKKTNATALSAAASKRAVEELTVYLRAMKSAQRRWAREILAHESHVRRLMLVEEQCRDKLRQQVLKGTREHLKYLTNTDLMAVSQLVSPPSLEVFLAYGIPAEQISGFSVYVMGCLAADANRLNVPLPMLLADLSSAWAILPPMKKDAFNELADIFRAHVPPRSPVVPATPKKSGKTTKQHAVKSAKTKPITAAGLSPSRRRRADTRVSPAARTFTGTKICLTENTARAGKVKRAKPAATPAMVTSARQRLHTQTKKSALSKPFSRHHDTSSDDSGGCKVAGAPTPSSAVPAVVGNSRTELPLNSTRHIRATSTLPYPHSHTCASSPTRYVVQMETDAMEAFARQLPAAEYDAFCCFAQESLQEMELALGAAIIPQSAQQKKTSRGVVTHSPSLPREVRLFMKEWLPIAAEEWMRKTRRQKSLYMKRD